MNSKGSVIILLFIIFMISTPFAVCHASELVRYTKTSSYPKQPITFKPSRTSKRSSPFKTSNPTSTPCPFTSFYTGVSIGESLTTMQINSATISNAVIPGSTVAINNAQIHYAKKDSWMVALFTGYGFAFDPFYLGGELFFKICNPQKTIYNAIAVASTTGPVTSGLAETTTVKTRKLESALDLRPGFYLSACNMIYGRVGASFNTISVSSALNSVLFNAGTFAGPVTQGLLAASTKHAVGLRLGLGIEQSLFKSLSFRLDYIFTQYKRMNLANSQVTTIAGAPVRVGTFLDARNVKVFNHSFMMGMSYYW